VIPAKFDQSNQVLIPPGEFDENQCKPIHACVGKAVGGSCDGARVVITAWKPTDDELYDIMQGNPIFLTCIGGLQPHFLSTSFEQAIRPA